MKVRVRLITKAGDVFFGDPYEIDSRNRHPVWLNKKRYSQQFLDEAAKCASKHGVSILDIERFFEESAGD